MKRIALILPILLCCSCGIFRPKIVVNTEVEYRDITIYKETLKDTTIYVPIPLEKDQAIVKVGEVSHRETSFAKSDAWVGEDGFLHHTLENKSDKTVPVTVPIRSMFIQTNVSSKKAETLTKFVEVEKPLPWWKSFKIEAFWWLLLLIAVGFRREIIALIKKLY